MTPIAPDAPVRAARLEGPPVRSAESEDATDDDGCDSDHGTRDFFDREPLHTAGFDIQPAAEKDSTYVPVGLLGLLGAGAFLFLLASIDTRRRKTMGL